MWKKTSYVKFIHRHALFSLGLSAYLAFQCNSRSLEGSSWPTHHCAATTIRKPPSPTYTSNKSSTIRIAVWSSETITMEQSLGPSDGSRNVSMIQMHNSRSVPCTLATPLLSRLRIRHHSLAWLFHFALNSRPHCLFWTHWQSINCVISKHGCTSMRRL